METKKRGLLQLVAYGPQDYYIGKDNTYSEICNIYNYGWENMICLSKKDFIDNANFHLQKGLFKDENKVKMMIEELKNQEVPKEVLDKKRQDMEILCGLRPWPNERWWMKPKWIISKLKGEL